MILNFIHFFQCIILVFILTTINNSRIKINEILSYISENNSKLELLSAKNEAILQQIYTKLNLMDDKIDKIHYEFTTLVYITAIFSCALLVLGMMGFSYLESTKLDSISKLDLSKALENNNNIINEKFQFFIEKHETLSDLFQQHIEAFLDHRSTHDSLVLLQKVREIMEAL